MAEPLPDFNELPEIEGLGLRHAWDVWGRDDALGSMNLVTDERVAAAAQLVQTGERINLDLPLNIPNPPLFGRQPYEHVVFALSRNEMDDRLDNFHLQGSTQWDGLNHVRCREHGFWGGRTGDPIEGSIGLGVHHWAEHGIAGRGVLIDLVALFAEEEGSGQAGGSGEQSSEGGTPRAGGYHPLGGRAVTAEDVARALDRQGVKLQPGDLLCFRFGWPAAYRALDTAEREAYSPDPRFSGLIADEEMARFLWNSHPAAICCDNPAVEVVPGDPAIGSLHRRLLPTLGMALGEMFDFETLSRRLGELGRSTFFFVAAPLNVPDALGSPGNALAIL